MLRPRFALCALLALAALPSPAAAQVSRVGTTFNLWTAPTRGSSIAYDPKSDVYLAVSASGTLRGRFISADGVPLGTAFIIQASANYTHFPRVAYSPDADGGAGGFLVTWHESDAAITTIHCRIVSYTHGVIGADTRFADTASFWEVGAGVAYSTGSQEFLIVWRSFAPGNIYGVRVDNLGVRIGGILTIAATAAHEDNPNVAYNPTTNEFMVVHTSITDTPLTSTLYGKRIQAGTGALVGTGTPIGQSVGIYITDVAYDSLTGLYLATWYQDPPKAIYGRLLNADGTVNGNINALSVRYRAYDALSLAHNPISGTFFAVSHDSITSEDGGVEIDPAGTPLTTGIPVTAAGGIGNFYPRIASHTARAEWISVTAYNFAATLGQRLSTATRSGGGGGGGGTTDPKMGLDAPGNNVNVTTAPFTVSGWAIDAGAASGTGVTDVHVWAFPVGGSSFFIGAATLGGSRADVCAGYGARFVPCGFSLTTALAPGTYDITAYPYSTVARSFNNVRAARIQVVAAPERVAIGLGPYTNSGGAWFAMRNDLSWNISPSTWGQVPWPSYGARGGGIHIAAGDVDGDGLDELVVGLSQGGNGWLAVFDDAEHGFALLQWIQVSWPEYNAAYGEVWPAVGDIDGDGKAEIVAGLGYGGYGWYEIFDDAAAGFSHLAWRQVQWPNYTAMGSGATHPTIADGKIILGLGTGGNGWLEVITGAGGGYEHNAWFQTGFLDYNATNGATFPAAGDIDGDGMAEVVVGFGAGGGGWLEIVDDASSGFAMLRWLRVSWDNYNTMTGGETHPAVGNIDGDAAAEIVVGLGDYAGNGGWFETFDDGLVGGNPSLGWRNVGWTAFTTAGGATYPAIGHFRN